MTNYKTFFFGNFVTHIVSCICISMKTLTDVINYHICVYKTHIYDFKINNLSCFTQNIDKGLNLSLNHFMLR